MITTVDCVSLVAWISGFLINCQGKKQFFEKNKDRNKKGVLKKL